MRNPSLSWSWFLVLAATVGCGAGTAADGDASVDEPDAGPVELGPIERCAAEGRALELAWSEDNQHGEVLSTVTNPEGKVVLGSIDKTVKVWEFGFGGASAVEGAGYGTPYPPGAGIARALAFSADGMWLGGGDDSGEASVWWANESDLETRIDTGDRPLTAVAFLADGQVAVADDSFGGAIRVWDLDAETLGPALATRLWFVSAFAVDGDLFYTAGDEYGTPVVEVRSAAAPAEVTTSWATNEWTTNYLRIALGFDGRIFVAGAGFVALLPSALDGDPLMTAAIDGLAAVAIAPTPSGDFFAVLDAAGVIRFYESATGDELLRVEGPVSVGIGFDTSGEVIMAPGSDAFLRAYHCPE